MDYKTKTALILPFNGTWKVTNGGRTPETNSHNNPERSPKSMEYAYDFRLEHIGTGENLDDYEVFGKEVISPADGKIVQIDAKAEPPSNLNVPESELRLYTPKDPIDYVLEVNSGFSQKKSFSIGDSIDLTNAL